MKRSYLVGTVAGLLIGLLTFAGCGGEEFDELGLALEFGTETMPTDTERITVYVLPSIVNIAGMDEPVNCDLFVGPTADKEIYDYSDFLVDTPYTVGFDPVNQTAVAVVDLPEGLLIFLVEAVDEPGNLLAMGCGKGQISRGEKTFIPIFMEER